VGAVIYYKLVTELVELWQAVGTAQRARTQEHEHSLWMTRRVAAADRFKYCAQATGEHEKLNEMNCGGTGQSQGIKKRMKV
jgi:hypothetical protein